MNETYDDISSLHWRYPLSKHRQWSQWWSRLVKECGGDLNSARALREMQAQHCPGMSVAYLCGVVRGRWAGE